MDTCCLGGTVRVRARADLGEAAGFGGRYVDGGDAGDGGDVDDAGWVLRVCGFEEEGFEADGCVEDCFDVEGH